MPRALPTLTILAAMVVLAPGGSLHAQASPDLPTGSRVEWAVEKLVGFGLVDDRIVSVRPWSRTEALRLLEHARSNLNRLSPRERAAAEAILDEVRSSDVERGLRVTGVAEVTAMDSPWLAVPQDTNTGSVEADVNHLARYRIGREYVEGLTGAAELDVEGSLGHRVAAEFRPRIWWGEPRAGVGEGGVQVLQAQARLQWSNLRFDVGRSTSVWGPGRNGGGLLAGNTRGLDRIRVSSDAPFQWPGFLSVLGPTQAEVFIAVLEEDRAVPRSKLVGYNVAVRPHPRFEAWFATLIQSGGEGAPTASAWSRIADHLLFIDWIFNGGETFLFSNKGTSLGFQLRMPSWRHAQLFAEFTLEDKGHNLRRIFWQDGAWLLGVWVPRLDVEGVADLRFEFYHSGYRMHRHSQFRSGRTLDRRLLGLGDVNTDGAFLEVGINRPGIRATVEAGVENRSADVWDARFRPDGELDVLEKIDDRPDEFYLRGLISITAYADDGREFSVGVGLARVTDSRFQNGATRHDGVVRVRAAVPLGPGF